MLFRSHFNTALTRMESFPIRIGLLSRYRTAKEQKETLRGLKDGTVDIVVGIMAGILNYKFNTGKLKALSFGDIYLLGMKELYGDFAESIKETSI